MAQSAEGAAGGSPPPKKEVAAFVIGLVLGLGIGGTVLTLVSFAIIASLFPKSSNNIGWLPFLADIPALALGWWAIVQSRKALNFLSGALIGLAAGMLGGVTLCAFMVGGLSDMH